MRISQSFSSNLKSSSLNRELFNFFIYACAGSWYFAFIFTTSILRSWEHCTWHSTTALPRKRGSYICPYSNLSFTKTCAKSCCVSLNLSSIIRQRKRPRDSRADITNFFSNLKQPQQPRSLDGGWAWAMFTHGAPLFFDPRGRNITRHRTTCWYAHSLHLEDGLISHLSFTYSILSLSCGGCYLSGYSRMILNKIRAPFDLSLLVNIAEECRESKAVCWLCSGHCNIPISRGPGVDSRARQEKEVPMNTLVCSCGSFVELSWVFRYPWEITSPLRSILGLAKATCWGVQC